MLTCICGTPRSGRGRLAKTLSLIMALQVFPAVAQMAGPDALHNDGKRFAFRFRDRTVAPEFHRSFTIEVDQKRMVCTIDVYGKALSTRQRSSSPAELESLIALLPSGAGQCQPQPANDCYGGWTETIEVTANGNASTILSRPPCRRRPAQACREVFARVASALASAPCEWKELQPARIDDFEDFSGGDYLPSKFPK